MYFLNLFYSYFDNEYQWDSINGYEYGFYQYTHSYICPWVSPAGRLWSVGDDVDVDVFSLLLVSGMYFRFIKT